MDLARICIMIGRNEKFLTLHDVDLRTNKLFVSAILLLCYYRYLLFFFLQCLDSNSSSLFRTVSAAKSPRDPVLPQAVQNLEEREHHRRLSFTSIPPML